MTEIIRFGDIKRGDTFVHKPFVGEEQILEVTRVIKRDNLDLGGTVIRAFNPKTGEYVRQLHRSNNDVEKISSINPETGEIVYP